MDPQINRLALRANRSLGSELTQSGLVQVDPLDEANELCVQRLRAGDLREASLLRILLYDLQVLDERALLDWQLERATGALGALSLNDYKMKDELMTELPLAECVATWTLPIDRWSDMTFLASAYRMSDFVEAYWRERTGGPITWMLTPFAELDAFFEDREDALRHPVATAES